jgi:valyl-tRNA synthetase
VVEAFDAQAQGVNFMVKTGEFFVPLNEHINVEEEVAKMKAEIEYYEKFLKQVNAKLGNEKFVNNAPESVVAMERKKQSDATTKLENLHNRIAALLGK